MKKRFAFELFLVAILVLGIAFAGYLTYVHYNAHALVCPEGSIINCGTVLSSPYETVLGIPIALAGLIWFVVALLLELAKKDKLAGWWSLLALGGALYSITAMYLIGRICIYCASMDVILLLYFALRIGSVVKD